MHSWLGDPWIEAQIDAAIEPYRGKWTERQIEIFREKAAWALQMHPATKRLLAVENAKDIDRSGERSVGEDGAGGASARDDAEATGRGSKAG